MTATQAPQPPEPFVVRSSRRGKGFLSVTASMFIPGTGHLIARAPRRAVFWFIVWIAIQSIILTAILLPSPLMLLAVALPALIFLPGLYIDAYLTGRRNPSPAILSAFARYLVGILFIVAAYFVSQGEIWVLQRFGKAYLISTRAMQPALFPGDRIFVRVGLPPRRWDIVVFHPPFDPTIVIVDRVVGLPGETVEITNAAVLINGQPLTLPPGVGHFSKGLQYQTPIGSEGNPIHLASDEYFILGDNTQIARDSRFWYDPAPGHQPGALPATSLMGTATMIYWPISHARETLR